MDERWRAEHRRRGIPEQQSGRSLPEYCRNLRLRFPSGLYASLAAFETASLSAAGDPYASYFKITGIYSAPTGGFAGSASHDDRASLYVDGTSVFTSAAETTDKTSSSPLLAGTHSFELDYVEGNGSPSVLNVTFPDATSVPEPMTLALLGTGLIGLGVARRRKAA